MIDTFLRQVKEEVIADNSLFSYLTLMIDIGQIFGPVLSVGIFKTEEEAVALANDTTYGLGAGLHSSKLARFLTFF